MSRPRLIETKKFGGCQGRDSSRLKNFEDVETETNRDSSKGVKTETETESFAIHWVKICKGWSIYTFTFFSAIKTKFIKM